jgi:hypothetical protein
MDHGHDQDRLYEYDNLCVEKVRHPDSRRNQVWYRLIGSTKKLIKNA